MNIFSQQEQKGILNYNDKFEHGTEMKDKFRRLEIDIIILYFFMSEVVLSNLYRYKYMHLRDSRMLFKLNWNSIEDLTTTKIQPDSRMKLWYKSFRISLARIISLKMNSNNRKSGNE